MREGKGEEQGKTNEEYYMYVRYTNEERSIMSGTQVFTHIVCVNLFLNNLQVSMSCPTHPCRMLAPLQPIKFLLSYLEHMTNFSKGCLKS